MTQAPIIAAKKPTKVELEAGKDYFWCRCGQSKSQPFCDGSHRGTGLSPQKFTAEKDGAAMLCQCKASANAPFCDGSHARLGDLQAGDPAPEPKSDIPQATPTPEEPTVARIHALARDGLSKLGHHGEMGSMGIPRKDLPHWDDIQILPAQMARKPLLDDVPVATEVVIGPRAAKPLVLDIPLFVSDMSYGALSEEAKTALARGAEAAGTGICSGEGGMLPEEQAANSRYFYELASAQFGWSLDHVAKVQAFHFKGGQGAKTGTGGHLPGEKVQGKIAEVRGLAQGQDAISPATFVDLHRPEDFKRLADQVRERSGGIPIGFKLSANHIEDDIDFALAASADYIILDGRGGGTGAAPLIFRDHISVPTIAALARARRHLDARTGREVTLVITGGLRVAEDFAKALALGADAVAVSNAAMQAVGCIAARMCNSNNCPVGVATQKPELRKRLDVQRGADQLERYFGASVELMQVLARACGHDSLSGFSPRDITSWKREVADLSGIRFAGVG
ncbi:glutamate synthase-related protein [Thalassobius sp. Cn5-15]|uniref:glutamate synthase-related protein n=1 Tax=Thalassobius sp. Cn5-15 TaxID=2917763 RepID=UPI001EF2E62A|nr:glutamate synthase-related protein [Thalassobius sp. Cn5-15]MCG7492157.1 glutamate synthase-related protein [Thalassobius sp. Cn5-15]